jgi:hypothetical protein
MIVFIKASMTELPFVAINVNVGTEFQHAMHASPVRFSVTDRVFVSRLVAPISVLARPTSERAARHRRRNVRFRTQALERKRPKIIASV